VSLTAAVDPHRSVEPGSTLHQQFEATPAAVVSDPVTRPWGSFQDEVDAPDLTGWAIIPEGSDDFLGGALDTQKWWVYDDGKTAGGKVNASQLGVGDGLLTISGQGAGKPGAVSGGLQTAFATTYGRWTVRFREDAGAGYGAGVLLWPADEVWPEHGELDIAEIPKGDRQQVFTAIHYGARNRVVGAAKVKGDFTQFHTFTLEWTEHGIKEWLDGKVILDVKAPKEAIPSWPMRFAMQQDIGTIKCPGGWVQCANGSTPAVVKMQVDYVHAYRQG